MWDAIRDVLMSSNVTYVLPQIIATFIFLILLGVILSKIGLLNIRTESVQIGAVSREREIVRQQIDWIRQHYTGLETIIPKSKGYNEWHGKYVTERVISEWIIWIIYNHFRDTKEYIEIKQDKIVEIVRSNTIREEYHSEEFEQFLRDDTKKCVRKLIQIRNVYK